MGSYIIKRLFHSVFVLLGITLIIFVLLSLSGDPVRLLVPIDATEQEYQEARERLGFNEPLYVQYFKFLGRVAKLDFGTSLKNQVPVSQLIKEFFPNTVLLTTAAFILALLLAVPMGIFAAIKRNSIFDFLISTFVLIGQATPLYWLGLVFILVFAVQLKWLPSGGFGYTENLILPAVTISLFSMSRIARMSRSSMLEVLAQDFIRTARSQGIREILVNFKYALKNASIPIVTLIGVEYCILMEGAVVTELIFSWPGIGRLLVQAVYDRDYPIVQGVVILVTAIIVFVNIGIDIFYTYLDPRIKYGRNTK